MLGINNLNPNHSSKSGFTLVELLIVIVVIAILAAISVVAYNGIQDRAKDAKLVSIADAAEKKVQLKKFIDGKASPTVNASSVSQLRQHYELAESLGNSIVIMTFSVNGNCIAAQSDTCDYDDPVFQRDDVVVMEILTTGSTGGGMSGCDSHGGVIISHPLLSKLNSADPDDDDFDWDSTFSRIEIPDDQSVGVGQSCWSLT